MTRALAASFHILTSLGPHQRRHSAIRIDSRCSEGPGWLETSRVELLERYIKWKSTKLLTDEQEERIFNSKSWQDSCRGSCTCSHGKSPSSISQSCARVQALSKIAAEIESCAEDYRKEHEDLFFKYVLNGSKEFSAKSSPLERVKQSVRCLQDHHTSAISNEQ